MNQSKFNQMCGIQLISYELSKNNESNMMIFNCIQQRLTDTIRVNWQKIKDPNSSIYTSS